MSGRTCAYCQNENRDCAKYCDNCGRALTVTCLCCHCMDNPLHSLYCCHCGASLALEPDLEETEVQSVPETTTSEPEPILDDGAEEKVPETDPSPEASAENEVSADNSDKDSLVLPPASQALRENLEDTQVKLSYASLKEGDCFSLGYYQQTVDGYPTKLEWQVLKCNMNSITAITRQAIACQRFHSKGNSVFRDTNWKRCDLRKWLNTEFFSEAFNYDEQACVLQCLIIDDAPDSVPGVNETNDRVFLLSNKEAQQMMSEASSRQCLATAFAQHQGTSERCRWWLRSNGTRKEGVHLVEADGELSNAQPNAEDVGVRPVIMLALS